MKALILVPLMVQGMDARVLPDPRLDAMEVRGDTAWFYERSPWNPERSVVAYGRSLSSGDGVWVRDPAFEPRPAPGVMPGFGRDTVVVDEGLALVRDRARGPHPFLVASAGGRTIPIATTMSEETKLRLMRPDTRYPPYAPEEIVGFSHGDPVTWLRSERTMWFGLRGGTSEGFLGFGGLLRLDLETGDVEGVWLDALAESEVTGLAMAEGELWIASWRPGEYGPYPGEGLLAYDPDTGRVRRYTSDGSGLPDHLIQGIREHDGYLWVSTRAGVSRFDPRDESWRSAFHTPELAGDSVIFRLVEGRAAPDSVRINTFLAMQELGVERRAEFLETAATLSPDRFRGSGERAFTPERALSDPVFVPFLIEGLGTRHGALGAAVLRDLPGTEPAIRRALAGASAKRAVVMARHLARTRHPVGLEWIGDHLDPATTDSVRLVGAIEAVTHARDDRYARRLVSLLDVGRYAWPAADVLVRFDMLEDWEPVAAWALRTPNHWPDLLRRAPTMRWSPAWGDDVLQAAFCTVAHEALASEDRTVVGDAATTLVFLRDPHGPEAVIDRFMDSETDMRTVGWSLAHVFDRRPRPEASRSPSASRAFWSDWLDEAGRSSLTECERAPEPGVARAPAPPDLDYGPHGVGFTVVEALDSTRAFRPLRDPRGRLARETARPVQVSIWYPAEAAPDAARMRAGEFRLLRESELDPDAAPGASDAERLRTEFIETAVGFGQDRAAAERAWDDETPAVRGAAPEPGPHPAVLYFTAAGVSNPLLPAYLASHGFVVASFPSNGRMTEVSLEFTPNALTLDTDIDDAGFAYALLRELPYADTRRLAVASFSGGSLAALLWTMRDMQPAAIVAVEGWERYRRGADIVARSVHYEPHRVRVPFLMLERAADETSAAYAKVPDVVGALPYADIVRVSFRDASHGDFLSHVAFGPTASHPEIYEASARIIRRFLAGALGHEAVASAARPAGAGAEEGEVWNRAPADALPDAPADGLFVVERDPAVGPVPTEEELYRLAETDPPAAVAAYREATAVVPGSALFRRHVLERAALFAATAADSAAIMEIVSDAYPDTASASGPAPLAGAEPAFLAVSVSDLDEAAEWYRRILGLEVVRDLRSADGSLRARVLSAGPVVVELVHHTSTVAVAEALESGAHRFQLQGIVKSGLFVPDIERLYDALGERGVERDASIGTDRELEWRFFVFRDLDGNRIQAFERCGAECG